jgi:DNA-binding transcriptional MerR regulator
MIEMKPNHLATLLGISGSTLRLWSGKEYAEFLSPNAVGINGAHRSFSDRDARIVAWIATLRGQNTPPVEIIAMLRAAQASDWHNLPPLPGGMANDEPIAVIPREAAEERLTAIEERYELQVQALTKERDAALAQVAKLETENADQRTRLNAVTDQLLDLNRRLTSMLEKERRRK